MNPFVQVQYIKHRNASCEVCYTVKSAYMRYLCYLLVLSTCVYMFLDKDITIIASHSLGSVLTVAVLAFSFSQS